MWPRLGRCVVFALCACGRLSFEPRDAITDATTADAEELAVDAQLATDAPFVQLDAGACPAGYIAAAASCYRFGPQVPTWLDAELACEADAVGAHLVTIDSVEEANLLIGMFGVPDYWVGVTDRTTEGVYRSVTGELAPYLVWRPGEPTSSDCGQFDDVGEFHVSTCDTSDEYICEADGRPPGAGAY